MEEQTKTFDWKRLLITAAMVVLAAGAVGGTTYYVLNSNFQKERDANDKALNDVRDQIKAISKDKEETNTTTKTSVPTVKDETADWKTYSGNGFQFKYPSSYSVSNGGYVRGILFTVNATGQTGGGNTFVVEGYVKASSIALNQWLPTTDAPGINYLSDLRAGKVGLENGYSFLKSGMTNYTAYAVSEGDTAFVISGKSDDTNFQKILNTFKLI